MCQPQAPIPRGPSSISVCSHFPSWWTLTPSAHWVSWCPFFSVIPCPLLTLLQFLILEGPYQPDLTMHPCLCYDQHGLAQPFLWAAGYSAVVIAFSTWVVIIKSLILTDPYWIVIIKFISYCLSPNKSIPGGRTPFCSHFCASSGWHSAWCLQRPLRNDWLENKTYGLFGL